MQAKNSPYGNILAPGDASGLNVNGYLMSRFGLNGVPTSKKGDKYYIAVDANNKLRSGIQVNGADKITWKEIATKDDLTPISEAITQPSLDGITFNDWIVLAERCGNMVTLSFNISGTMKAVSDFIPLRTLPVKYRPLKQHFQAYTTQTGKPMTLNIDPNGQISLFNNNIEVSGFFLRQTISYPAE